MAKGKGIALILHFENDDVRNKPQPWPVAIDPANVVQSGLGLDDGARFIGLGPAGEQRISVNPGVVRLAPDVAIGMTASFSNHDGIFLWKPVIARVEIKEIP